MASGFNNTAFGVGLLGSINSGMAADADQARQLKLYEDKKSFDAVMQAKKEDEDNQRAATEHVNNSKELAGLINNGDDPDPASLAVASAMLKANGGKYSIEDVPTYQQAAQQIRTRLWQKKTGAQPHVSPTATPQATATSAQDGTQPTDQTNSMAVSASDLQAPTGTPADTNDPNSQYGVMSLPGKNSKALELHKQEKQYDMQLEQKKAEDATQRGIVPPPSNYSNWDYSKGTNEPYLTEIKSKDPQLAQDVDALHSGLQQYPTPYMLVREEAASSDKRWTKALAATRYYDPDFSENASRTMQNTIDAFSKPSSKDYQSVQAGNTIAKHLKLLQDAAPALENGDVQAWNHVANMMGVQTGSSAPSVFNAVNEKLAEELARLYIGGVPSDQDIARQKQNLASFSSPNQVRDVTDELVKLAGGKMSSLDYDYKTGLGRAANHARDIFTPEARGIFFPQPQQPQTQQQPQQTQPQQVTAVQQQAAPTSQQNQQQQEAQHMPHIQGKTPEEVMNSASYKNLPPGTQFVDPEGKIRTKPGAANGPQAPQQPAQPQPQMPQEQIGQANGQPPQ